MYMEGREERWWERLVMSVMAPEATYVCVCVMCVLCVCEGNNVCVCVRKQNECCSFDMYDYIELCVCVCKIIKCLVLIIRLYTYISMCDV